MKKTLLYIALPCLLAACDVLDTVPTDRLSSEVYWKTDQDAELAAIGQKPVAESESTAFKQKVASRQEAINEQQQKEAAEDLLEQITDGNSQYGTRVVLYIFAAIYLIVLIYNLFKLPVAQAVLDTITYGTIINLVVALLFINKLVEKVLDTIAIKRWKRAHPNDPRNKYL